MSIKIDWMFLDESGDLGLKGSNHFVITIIRISESEYKKLKKILKKIRKNLPKKYKRIKKLKATKLDKQTKEYILKKTNKLDFRVFSIILNKKSHKNVIYIKKVNKNDLYMDITCELMKKIESIDEIVFNKNISIKLDKFVHSHYIPNFTMKILENLKLDKKKKIIKFANSEQYKGIQFVDLLSWCVYQKIENNEKNYLKEIETKLIKFDYRKIKRIRTQKA